MCGFVGFLGDAGQLADDDGKAYLKRMADTIVHRGPDDAGYWCDADRKIGLGHRRLAIVDLSPAGHQPMVSVSGRYVFAFNGEIYNHLLLRQELEAVGAAPNWRGHSDTETLIAGFDAWGIEGTIKRTTGMFAFAVWDRQSKALTLGRDRIGEKPLYYGWQDNTFLFGSELKALKVHPAFKGEINREAISLLLRHNYIPAPYSIYKGISKLKPGCLLTISLTDPKPKPRAYWSASDIAIAGVENSFSGSPEEAVDELEVLLKDAVRQQMVADVPLGAFLSGGVDSSTVVALMQTQSSHPVKTFTIGFHEEGYNEAEHAKDMAKHLGTDHTELYVTADQAMAVIPRLPTLYDEPFSDSSQIPTLLVSQLARQHVKVSLSGDAGDELFCGYQRYMLASKLWRGMSAVPLPLREFVSMGITSLSPQVWNRLATPVRSLLLKGRRPLNLGDKLHKGARVLSCQSSDALYRDLISQWHDPASVVIGAQEPATMLTGDAPKLDGLDNQQRMMALDTMTYLPDDILVKVDRAAMGVSLETRVPLLDHRVVEFAWRLPQDLKLRDGESKWALRQVLYRYVPKTLIERPKMGFGVPIDSWLRGPLRDWADALLSEERLLSEGFFNPALVRKKWEEHLQGKRNWQHQLWGVLMFQAWLEEQK